MIDANGVPTTESTRSPQAEIIDELIWSNLSRFWTQGYNPNDLDAISAVYEAYFHVLDAEYVRLFEINQAKSLDTTPIFTQRRWTQLDMNKYNEMAAFLRFLRSGLGGGIVIPGVTGSRTSAPNQLDCDCLPTRHARHWHIHFPYSPTHDEISSTSGSAGYFDLDMGLPIGTPSLVWIYRIFHTGDGVGRGVRQRPKIVQNCVDATSETATSGFDFEVLQDGHTIRVHNAAAGNEYEFVVGFDLGAPEYDCFRPTVYMAGTPLTPNTVQIPAELVTGLPFHVLVVHTKGGIDTGLGGLQQTNSLDFGVRRTFYRFTRTASDLSDPSNPHRCAYGSTGEIILSTNANIGPNDVVFVFMLESGVFDTVHVHKRFTTLLENKDTIFGLLPTFTPTDQIPMGLFGSINFFGQQLQIFLNGYLISPSDYLYNFGDNTFTFGVPPTISVRNTLELDILYTDERRAGENEMAVYHLHQECFKNVVRVTSDFGHFDDGGNFDDGGHFDDREFINEVYFTDVPADPESIEVYLDGQLQDPDIDYSVSFDGNVTRITFYKAIDGRSVLVTFRTKSLIYVYGLQDIAPGSLTFGITLDTLYNILSDLQNVVAKFEATYGSRITDLATLLEAAYIAASGGNPLLALFLDEWKEYDGLPLDAADQFLDALAARNLESANTELISIPFFQDHVYSPTLRLVEGIDYEIIDGNIESSVDLTKSSSSIINDLTGNACVGPTMSNAVSTTETSQQSGNPNSTLSSEDLGDDPGIWWLPQLILDEHVLAKNFGAVLNDLQESSIAYRDSLTANLLLRFGGPVTQNIAYSAAIMLGSPMFTQDSKITSVYSRITAYRVTIVSAKSDKSEVIDLLPDMPRPKIGMPVFTGQSLNEPVVIDTTLSLLAEWHPGILIVNQDFGAARINDKVRIQLFNPANAKQSLVVELNIEAVQTSPILGGYKTTILFREKPKFVPTTESTFRVFRNSGPPQVGFDGIVANIDQVKHTVIATEYEEFDLPEGAPAEYRVNDQVSRGMPVRPGLATAYDDVSRPNWHWIYPSYNRSFWDYLQHGDTVKSTEDLTDERYATLAPPTVPGGYTQAFLSQPYPLPERGSVATFVEDNTLTESKFTVVGTNDTIVLLTPVIQKTTSGTLTFVAQPTQPTVDQVEYFEVKPGYVNNKYPEAIQEHAQLVNSSSMDMVDVKSFPTAGRINILLDDGGLVEMEYYDRTDKRLLHCKWRPPFDSLLSASLTPQDPGTLNSVIPITARFVLVSQYEEKLLNPAFISLVNERTESEKVSEGITISKPVITRDNADEFYNLLKTNASVLELSSVRRPDALRIVLQDVQPACSTIEIVNKHTFADVCKFSPADSEISYAPLSVQIEVQYTSLNILSATALTKTFAFGGAPDLGTVNPGDTIHVSGTRNNINDGDFTVVTIDNALKTITVVEAVANDLSGSGSVLFDQPLKTIATTSTMRIPKGLTEILFESVVVDPDGHTPFTYQWKFAGLTQEKALTPNNHSTRVTSPKDNAEYLVELHVENAMHQVKDVYLTVLVNL